MYRLRINMELWIQDKLVDHLYKLKTTRELELTLEVFHILFLFSLKETIYKSLLVSGS